MMDNQFEQFLFRDIPFTILQVICTYFIIVALVQVYKFKSFKWIAIALIGIILFQGTFIYNQFKNQDDAFIVFNKSRNPRWNLAESHKTEKSNQLLTKANFPKVFELRSEIWLLPEIHFLHIDSSSESGVC